MKKLLAYLLIPFSLCAVSLEPPSSFYLDTIDFDIDDSLSFTRPNWNDSDATFYYNLVSFTVDTAGEWRAANSSITSHDSFDYSRYPNCLLYTSPSPRDVEETRMPSSA